MNSPRYVYEPTVRVWRLENLFLFMVMCGLLIGCGKRGLSDQQAFEKAPPEIRDLWNKAVAADKSNDYVTSVVAYHSIMAQKAQLTDYQIEAVNAAALAINQRLYAAAGQGEADAKEASLKLAAMQSHQ